MELADRKALVTGASRGIGAAVARELARRGAVVVVHYHRNRQAAEETRESLRGAGHRILQADVADPAQCEALVGGTIEAVGGLDVLVNNAGVFEPHPLADVEFEEWRRSWDATLGANLLGPANLCYQAAHHMIRAGGGKIVNVSSRGAFRGEPEAPAYGASKAGLNSLSQSLAKALAPHGIFVGAVAPGWVETDMAANHLAGPDGDEIRAQSPLDRAARPEEIARAVAFLATEGIDYLTGCIIDANGASYLRT